MIRTLISRSTLLAVTFSCVASIAIAGSDDNNNNGNFTETVKRNAQQGVEWTAQKCAAAKKELQEKYAVGKEKSAMLFEEARTRANRAFSSDDSENNPQPKRPVINEPKDKDLIPLEVPFDVPADAQPTGAEPVKRSRPVITETIVIDGELVEMSSIELSDDAWFEWISSDEAQLIAKGAIAIVTIAGISYILYKNRVPQRITGYVAKNPVKSAVTTACLVALAAYITQDRGITTDSIKNMFCLPASA